MGKLHISVFSLVKFIHFVAPQQAGFHDVGFFHRAHPAASFARQIKRDPTHLANFFCLIDLGVDPAEGAIAQVFDPSGLAEIHTAGQFANDQNIQPRNQIRLQRRRINQGIEHDGWAQIGIQIHFFAQAEQAAFWLHREVQIIPFRPANGTKKNGIRGLSLIQGIVG